MAKYETTQGVPESHQRLLQSIGHTIMQHTMVSPMTQDEVIGILAFATGFAIGNANVKFTKGELRQLAIANIDNALHAALSDRGPKIII